MDIKNFLEEQGREKAASYGRSVDGQKEAVGKYRAWGFKEYKDCRESVVARSRWINPDGRKMVSVMPGISSGGDVPPDGVIESNHKSRKERLTKLTEFMAVIEAMLDQLRQKRPLHKNFIEELDRLKAALPNENVMEIVRGPKLVK
jgi:hypothetical protein